MQTRVRSGACAELEEMGAPFEAVRKQIGGVRGWLRRVRQMDATPVEEIAQRMGVLKREILRLEVAERSGRITLGRLRGIADAMDCELVYAFVPKETTFEELAQCIQTAKKEARQERIRKRKQKEREKRDARYGDVSELTLLALAVQRELRKYGIKILGKKTPPEKREGWGVRPEWGKGCIHCQR